jgi:hypothetical protein
VRRLGLLAPQSPCHETVALPADLPMITSAEIDELVRAGRAGGFALATDAADVDSPADLASCSGRLACCPI